MLGIFDVILVMKYSGIARENFKLTKITYSELVLLFEVDTEFVFFFGGGGGGGGVRRGLEKFGWFCY